MKTTYADISGDVKEHDLANDGQPYPDCYNCLGTGKTVGFGHTGDPCNCRWMCENHEAICEPEES